MSYTQNTDSQFDIDLEDSMDQASSGFDLDFGDDDDAGVAFNEDTDDAILNAELEKKARQKEAQDQLVAGLEAVLANGNNATTIEIDQAIQELLNAFKETDEEVLMALSEFLCNFSHIPHKIIRYLAYDTVSVAQPLLEKSPALNEKELMNIIYMKTGEYWPHIASRHDLSAHLIDVLAEKRHFETSRSLLSNDAIELTERAYQFCLEVAKKRNELSSLMAVRGDLPENVARDIYWQVTNALRERIHSHHHFSRDELNATFKNALREFDDSVRGLEDPSPTPLMSELSKQYSRSGRLNPSTLVATLSQGRARFFIALFAQYSGIHPKVIFEAMKQPGGRHLAILCKSCGFNKESFMSVFLKSRSMVRSGKSVDAQELHAAIKVFDKIDVQISKRVLEQTVVMPTAHNTLLKPDPARKAIYAASPETIEAIQQST